LERGEGKEKDVKINTSFNELQSSAPLARENNNILQNDPRISARSLPLSAISLVVALGLSVMWDGRVAWHF
jgi:hypothetical protein